MIAIASRYKAIQQEIDEASAVFTPRPKLSTVPPPDSLQGSYYHPTYGILRPCPIPGTFLSPEFASEIIASMSTGPCPQILDSLPVRRILEISDLSIPTYIISNAGEVTIMYIRLAHFSGNIYNATAIVANAEVRLKEGLASVDEEGRWTDVDDVVIPSGDFLVEWVKTEGEEGLAFKGNAWGKGVGVAEPTGTGKQAAEIWFSKIQA